MVNYTRDDEHRRVRATFVGSVSLPELIAIVDRQLSEGAWTYGMLYDVRSMADAPSSDDSRALLAHVRQLVSEHGPRRPVAVVARSSAMVGTAQMYAYRAGDDLSFEVFWDTEDAERWLDQQMRP
jgi:hypothetical protein